MKIKTQIMLLALVASFKATVVFAFFDPNAGRWLNRDPMGDIGGAACISRLVTPKIDYPFLLERTVKFADGDGSLSDSIALEGWSQVNGNLFSGIANDPMNKVDPFGLDFLSYADCVEKYRNPISEKLPDLISDTVSKYLGSGRGSGPHVPGWVPPAGYGANTIGNALAGNTGRVGVGGVPPHPTSWQHKLLGKWGGRFLGRAAVALTIVDGLADVVALAGCGVAQAMH